MSNGRVHIEVRSTSLSPILVRLRQRPSVEWSQISMEQLRERSEKKNLSNLLPPSQISVPVKLY